MKCFVCSSTGPLRTIAVTVDGEPMRLAVSLCPPHSNSLIFRYGAAVGELVRENRESGGSLPAEAYAETDVSRAYMAAGRPESPVLNRSGGPDVGVPWPLCTHPEGCLVRVDVEGARCKRHGGTGRW